MLSLLYMGIYYNTEKRGCVQSCSVHRLHIWIQYKCCINSSLPFRVRAEVRNNLRENMTIHVQQSKRHQQERAHDMTINTSLTSFPSVLNTLINQSNKIHKMCLSELSSAAIRVIKIYVIIKYPATIHYVQQTETLDMDWMDLNALALTCLLMIMMMMVM